MSMLKELYSEISLIADSLCTDSFDAEDNLWNSAYNNNNLTQSSQCNLYSGLSGAVLFLLSFYEINKDKKYLAKALEGLQWIKDKYRQDKELTKTFFTGSLGISYVFYKAYSITSKLELYEEGSNVFNYYLTQEDNPNNSVDLINGISGEIIGLLHIHSFTKNDSLLEIIDFKISKLISAPFPVNSAITWENSIAYQRPLCGLSHGAAGIGWTFIELGNYFNNKAFYWLSDLTFRYENSCFDTEKGNWPDYRAPITKTDYDSFCKSFLEGNTDYFTKPSFSNAWCHGASGIGLSRVRSFELTKSQVYLSDLMNALNCTIHRDIKMVSNDSFCLCHGDAGNADLFISAEKVLSELNLSQFTVIIAKRIIESRILKGRNIYRIKGKIFSNDASLFRGDVGVGYFFLRLYTSGKTPSILLPTIPKRDSVTNLDKCKFLNASKTTFREHLFEKLYPDTFFQLKTFYPKLLKKYNEAFSTDNLLESVSSFFSENYEKNGKLCDLFILENAILSFMQKAINNSLLYIKTLAKFSKAKQRLKRGNFHRYNFFVSEHVLLISTTIDTSDLKEDVSCQGNNEIHYLCFFDEKGFKRIKVNDFNFNLINIIRSKPNINLHEIKSQLTCYIEADQMDHAEFNLFIINQLFEFLTVGILEFN